MILQKNYFLAKIRVLQRVVQAHPRAAFQPCVCGLRRGANVVVATLISYDNVKVAAKMTTRRRRS
jgi:hypothetical protein